MDAVAAIGMGMHGSVLEDQLNRLKVTGIGSNEKVSWVPRARARFIVLFL